MRACIVLLLLIRTEKEREKDLKDDDDGEGMRTMNTCQQHQRVTGLYRITKCTSNTEYTYELMKTKKGKGTDRHRHHQIEYSLLSRTYTPSVCCARRSLHCSTDYLLLVTRVATHLLSVCLLGGMPTRERINYVCTPTSSSSYYYYIHNIPSTANVDESRPTDVMNAPQ